MKGLEIKNVSKSYGETKALDGINLMFEEGKIYGLLGRNGAGKSTLLNILTNRVFADEGEVLLDGISIKEDPGAFKKMYLMSERDLYPEKMKMKDIFGWSREFYPEFDMDYAMELAEKFELNVKKNPSQLSTGFGSVYKAIVALSVGVPYVFLDEPVLGLDANNRELFYRILLERYIEKPFTMILSTHLIEEVSNVIEEVLILKKGKLIANESREVLLSDSYMVSGKMDLVDAYVKGRNVITQEKLGGLKTAYLRGKENLEKLPEGLNGAGVDLQKLFIQLTNV